MPFTQLRYFSGSESIRAKSAVQSAQYQYSSEETFGMMMMSMMMMMMMMMKAGYDDDDKGWV